MLNTKFFEMQDIESSIINLSKVILFRVGGQRNDVCKVLQSEIAYPLWVQMEGESTETFFYYPSIEARDSTVTALRSALLGV